MVDSWTGQVRKQRKEDPKGKYAHVFYLESGVMVWLADSCMIYGNISKAVTEEISQAPMLKYLLGKNIGMILCEGLLIGPLWGLALKSDGS